jgi:hypothetical protein
LRAITVGWTDALAANNQTDEADVEIEQEEDGRWLAEGPTFKA